MAKQKSVLTKLRENIMCDQISRKRNGNILFRQGFFYTGGRTEQNFKDSITSQLNEMELSYEVVDFGQTWKPFIGGAPVSRQSHWWVEVKI